MISNGTPSKPIVGYGSYRTYSLIIYVDTQEAGIEEKKAYYENIFPYIVDQNIKREYRINYPILSLDYQLVS